MKDITIRVVGITPLLTNAPTLMMQADRGPKTRNSTPSPEEEAAAGRYFDAAGNLALPTAAFRKCTISGAKGRKVGRTGLNTILMGALFPMDEFTTLLNPDKKFRPLGPNEYIARPDRCVLQGKSAIIRHRPMMTSWAADVNLEYDDEITDPQVIAEVMTMGGRTVGVGNWRPEKGGVFGRFRVESF